MHGTVWEEIGVIISGVSLIMGFVLTIISRYVAGQVTAAIDKLRIEVISKLDQRISVLESINSMRNRR